MFLPVDNISPQANDPVQELVWNEDTQTLEIDWSGFLGYSCRLYISGWQNGLHWYSNIEGEIHRPAPFEEPGVNLFQETDHPAIQQWHATIPEDILNETRRFSRWPFSLIRLAYDWVEARDLLSSNPILLWLSWRHFITAELSLPQLRELLRSKQPLILKELGLVGTKSSVRLLRKVESDAIGEFEARFIFAIWEQESTVRRLTHQQKMGMPFLILLKRFPWVAGSPLAKTIDEIECSWQYEDTCQLLSDSLRMGNAISRLRLCRSVAAIRRVHDQMVAEMNRNREHTLFSQALKDDNGNILPFPEIPFPGTDIIKAVETPEQLVEEGKRMHHCVAAYTSKVQRGEYYVYHCDTEEPLTIGVYLSDGKVTGINQVSGVCNRQPTADELELIDKWSAGF